MKTGVTKKEFIAKYAELLRMTREDIFDLYLYEYQDKVTINYKSGHSEDVNIACNSGMAIIRDVARRIG